jgi:asparagine synthase (glutamine-hydrolysing)
LWRQKEQFSDGVGYEWIDQVATASQVTDEQLAGAAVDFHNPPTKEAYLYRTIFHKHRK